MGAILNMSREAARDLEDNFHFVLSRELDGDDRRARDLARQLVERMDISGYRVDREELHREEDALIANLDDIGWNSEQGAGYRQLSEVSTGEEQRLLVLDALIANDA